MSFPQKFFVQKVNIVNQSTVVTDAEVAKIVSGLNMTLPAFLRDWKLATLPGGIVSTIAALPTGDANVNVIIMDTTDIPGTAGYRTLYNGTPTVKVFAKTILTAGGAILYENTRTKTTVSQSVCHEVLEALIDPECRNWTMNPSTGTLYACEVADAVDGNVKVVRLPDGTRVTVSDWILPAWYDVQNTVGPYNSLDTLSAPFTLSPGGYAMTTSGGSVNYLYGSSVSDVTKEYLQLSVRTRMRVSAVNAL